MSRWDDDEGGVDNDDGNGEEDDDAMVWQSINGKDTQPDLLTASQWEVPAGNRGKPQTGALQDSGAHRRGSPLVVGPKLFTMTSLGSAIVSPQGPNSELRDAHRVAVRVSQDIPAAASRRCTRSHPPGADGTIIRQAVGLTFGGPADAEGPSRRPSTQSWP